MMERKEAPRSEHEKILIIYKERNSNVICELKTQNTESFYFYEVGGLVQIVIELFKD